MDKAEAEKIANELLSRYALPEQEQGISRLTGVVCVYGEPVGGEIVTRQAALDLLTQLSLHPQKTIMLNDMPYTLTGYYLVGDEKRGKVFVDYERSKVNE